MYTHLYVYTYVSMYVCHIIFHNLVTQADAHSKIVLQQVCYQTPKTAKQHKYLAEKAEFRTVSHSNSVC